MKNNTSCDSILTYVIYFVCMLLAPTSLLKFLNSLFVVASLLTKLMYLTVTSNKRSKIEKENLN